MKRTFLMEAARGCAGAFILAFLAGPAACLACRLFRGPRERRFGYCATHICAVAAQFPALPAAVMVNALPRAEGSLAKAWRWREP